MVGIRIGDNVGLEDLLIDGFAVGVIPRREVGVLVLNAVGEAVNFEGLPVVVGAVNFEGLPVVVGAVNFEGLPVVVDIGGVLVLVGVSLGVTAIVGNLDVSNVGTPTTAGGAEGMKDDLSKILTFIISFLKSGKFTDPRPVVGSQPAVALKPSRQHGNLIPVPQLF